MNKDKEELMAISSDIRKAIGKEQRERKLSFIEDTHTYYIKDVNGELTNKLPSVSTLLSQFYSPFNDLEKSLKMCDNDIFKQDELLKTWRNKGKASTNIGSRVHYQLEKDIHKFYGIEREVRRPIFKCDDEQIIKGNNMISAGRDFIKLMNKRGAVLLDTEIVLGSTTLGYTGQPDKVWLMRNKKNELGIVITDWKTNAPKNFKVHSYTNQMLLPFQDEYDTALNHYKIQLPLYGRLLLDILTNTEFKDVKLFGYIIVHLLEDKSFQEYRIERKFINRVFDLNPLKNLEEALKFKKNQEIKESLRIKSLNKYKSK